MSATGYYRRELVPMITYSENYLFIQNDGQQMDISTPNKVFKKLFVYTVKHMRINYQKSHCMVCGIPLPRS